MVSRSDTARLTSLSRTIGNAFPPSRGVETLAVLGAVRSHGGKEGPETRGQHHGLSRSPASGERKSDCVAVTKLANAIFPTTFTSR